MSMTIIEVTATVHEKRNHPSEFGHYDTSVTLRATVSHDAPFPATINGLINMAKKQVEAECDRWEREIHREEKAERAKRELYRLTRRFSAAWNEEDLDLLRQEAWGCINDLYTVETYDVIADLQNKMEDAYQAGRKRLGLDGEEEE